MPPLDRMIFNVFQHSFESKTTALPGQRVGEVIAQEADDAKADLIVIGTHGRRGVSHLILGSVAETVVRAATIPVLLIHE